MLGRWIPGFDPATGILVLPPWVVAIGATVLGLLLLWALARALRVLAGYLLMGGRYLIVGIRHLRKVTPSPSRTRLTGAFSRVVLVRAAMVLAGAGMAWFVLDGWTKRELAVERRALEARAIDLTNRALMPGSALACLDASAGDTVEASCEKALFATPESTASAVSYVAAQLALLSDGAEFTRRDRSYAATLTYLRRAVEGDRFGLVAHTLAVRDGCTPEACRAFALLSDASRVRANLTERSFDYYVVRHAAGWPPIAKSPAASALPTIAAATPAPAAVMPPPAAAPPATFLAGNAASGAAPPVPANGATAQASARPAAVRPPGPNVFFPSAASIPPVSIMNAEPGMPSERAAPAAAAKPTPTAPRRPTPQSSAPPTRRPPVDLNAAAARAEPDATAQ